MVSASGDHRMNDAMCVTAWCCTNKLWSQCHESSVYIRLFNVPGIIYYCELGHGCSNTMGYFGRAVSETNMWIEIYTLCMFSS